MWNSAFRQAAELHEVPTAEPAFDHKSMQAPLALAYCWGNVVLWRSGGVGEARRSDR